MSEASNVYLEAHEADLVVYDLQEASSEYLELQ